MKKILIEDYLNSLTEDEKNIFLKSEEDAADRFARELITACGINQKELEAELKNAPTIEQYLGD